MECSPSGFPVHRISQARMLEWVAVSFSRGSFRPRDETHVPCTAGEFFTSEPPGKPQDIGTTCFTDEEGGSPSCESHRAEI